MVFSLFITSGILLLSIELSNSQPTETCVSNFNVLNDPSSELANAEIAMQRSFNETCHDEKTCSVEAKGDVATTTRDFTSLLPDNYVDLATKCDAVDPGKGNAVCLVSNQVRTSGQIKIIEAYKPVCFPAACSATEIDHVRLVDPTPGNCDPNDSTCEILSTSMECPVTRVPSDAGTCEPDAERVRKNNAMRSSLRDLAQTMTRACLGILFGQESDLCSVSTSIETELQRDYTGFVNEQIDSYIRYESVCDEAGGNPCTISAEFFNEESESFLNVKSYFNITNYPVCLPNECVRNDEVNLEDLAVEILADVVDCDDSDSCKKTVTNLSCKSPPTSAPSIHSSLTPSTTPTVEVVYSSQPSVLSTSSIPSSSPSLLPTDFSSTSPTVLTVTTPPTDTTAATSSSPSSSLSSPPTNSVSTSSPSTSAVSGKPTAVQSSLLTASSDATSGSGDGSRTTRLVGVVFSFVFSLLWFAVDA